MPSRINLMPSRIPWSSSTHKLQCLVYIYKHHQSSSYNQQQQGIQESVPHKDKFWLHKGSLLRGYELKGNKEYRLIDTTLEKAILGIIDYNSKGELHLRTNLGGQTMDWVVRGSRFKSRLRLCSKVEGKKVQPPQEFGFSILE